MNGDDELESICIIYNLTRRVPVLSLLDTRAYNARFTLVWQKYKRSRVKLSQGYGSCFATCLKKEIVVYVTILKSEINFTSSFQFTILKDTVVVQTQPYKIGNNVKARVAWYILSENLKTQKSVEL